MSICLWKTCLWLPSTPKCTSFTGCSDSSLIHQKTSQHLLFYVCLTFCTMLDDYFHLFFVRVSKKPQAQRNPPRLKSLRRFHYYVGLKTTFLLILKKLTVIWLSFFPFEAEPPTLITDMKVKQIHKDILKNENWIFHRLTETVNLFQVKERLQMFKSLESKTPKKKQQLFQVMETENVPVVFWIF